jgi:hypothetical protein
VELHIATVIANSLWVVGIDDNIQFWTDNWLGEPLVDIMKIDPIVHINFTGLLSNVIVNSIRDIPTGVRAEHKVAARLGSIVLPRIELLGFLT